MGTEQYNKNQSQKYYSKQLEHERMATVCRENNHDGFAPLPHTIALAVNNTCFLKCLHCDVGAAHRNKDKRFFYKRATGDVKGKREIPLDVLKNLIDDVADFRPVIRPTFLEPLLRRDLFEFAEYVKSKGLVFNLQTNGYLLPKRYKDAVDSGVDVLRVSIDGPRSLHDQIRGVPGTFDKAIQGLQSVVDLKRTRGLKHPILGLSYCISGHNYTGVVDFMNQLRQLNLLEHIYISFGLLRFVTQQEAESFNSLRKGFTFMTESSVEDTGKDAVDPERLIREIESLFTAYPREDYSYHFFPSELTKRDIRRWFTTSEFLHPEVVCHVPWSHCQILYNGDVVVNGRCCSPSFGNIYEHGFTDIWNSRTARDFRTTLKQHTNFSVCNRCCRKFGTEMFSG